MGDDIEDLDLQEFLERFYELEIQAHQGETFEGVFALIEHEVELARGDIDDNLRRWENEGMLESDFWKEMLRDMQIYQRELRRPRVVRAYNEHLRNIVEDNDAYAQLTPKELQAINKWRTDYHRIDTALQAVIDEIRYNRIPQALAEEANAGNADPAPPGGNGAADGDGDGEDPMHGNGPPRKMTDAEKEAARKLKEKLAKKKGGEFVEDDEDKADRLEEDRKMKLRSTEEGRQTLADEAVKKKQDRADMFKRYDAEEKAAALERLKKKDPLAWAAKQVGDAGLKGLEKGSNELLKVLGVDEKDADRITNAGRSLTEGNLGALKDLGQSGIKEILKRKGVNSDNAEKISGAVKNVVEKGSPGQEGIDAAKEVAKSEAKKMFDKGVENRRKLVEKGKEEEKKAEASAKPAVGSREMPAEVNVNIRNADANVPPNVPAIAAAAAAGEVAQSNIPPNAPQVAPGNPSTTSSPANLEGSGMPKRARSDSGSDDETLHVVHSMPRRGEYHMEGGSMHMHAQNRVYGGGIGNWSLPSLKDPSISKYFTGIGDQMKRTLNPNLAELTDKAVDTFGYTGYDAKTAKFLKEHGSEEVTSLTVRRAPVGSMLHTALNAISMGTWNKSRHEFGYDKLYHLGLIINRRYITQRLSRVTVTLKDADSPGTEFMEVNLKNNANELFTLKSMLQKTERSVGANVFFKYDSFKNNCQNFVLNILVANGLNNQALQQFILQPVDELLKTQPQYMQTVTNTLTNLGQITGAGKPPGMRGSGQGSSRAAASDEKEDEGDDETKKTEKERMENIANDMVRVRSIHDHVIDTINEAIDQYPAFQDQFSEVRARANRERNMLTVRYNDIRNRTRLLNFNDVYNFSTTAANCEDRLMELFDEINELKRQARNLPEYNNRFVPANGPFYAAGAGKPKGSK
jgi:hypothetical protein